MSNEVKVEKIVIKIGDKEHEFSMSEAKELRKLLNNLLGEKEFIYIPCAQPIYVEPYRIVPYPYTVPYTSPWTITYGTSDVTSKFDPTITCVYNSR